MAKQTAEITMVKETCRDFWSSNQDKIIIPGAAANIDFPDVMVDGIPVGVTIFRVVALFKVRAIKDTSGEANYIDQAGKALRVKKSTGSWGVDDVIAINFDQGQWYIDASSKEGGDVVIGNNDIASEVDVNATYNFRSEQVNRLDAISALVDNLELYDVQCGLRIWYSL